MTKRWEFSKARNYHLFVTLQYHLQTIVVQRFKVLFKTKSASVETLRGSYRALRAPRYRKFRGESEFDGPEGWFCGFWKVDLCLGQPQAGRRLLTSLRMLRMLVLKDHFLAKIRPAISLDIHDNIIKKNKGGGGWRPPPPLFLGPALPPPILYCHEYPARWLA